MMIVADAATSRMTVDELKLNTLVVAGAAIMIGRKANSKAGHVLLIFLSSGPVKDRNESGEQTR